MNVPAMTVAAGILLGIISGCSAQGQASAIVTSETVVTTSNERDRTTPLSMELTDVTGAIHHPFDDPSVRATALAFVVPDCPIANSYAPEWNRLSAEYEPRGVRLFLIQVDPDLSAESAREHAREYQLQAPVVLDARHEWVRKTGATVTPEMAVLSRSGELLYRGRIDDRYVGLGKRREQVTSHDLRDALDAILNDRPVGNPRTPVIGCPIPDINLGESAQ